MPPRKPTKRLPASRSTPLRALLFDLDGTIVDTMALTFDAMRRAARPYLGRLVEDSELEALLGPAEPAMLSALVGPNLAPACYARYERLYLARLRYLLRQREIGLAAGLTSFLAECRRQGIFIAVITGRTRSLAEQTLVAMGLRGRVDSLISGDDVVEPKPAPEGVLRALAELSLRPSEAIFVGDSPLDVQAGKKARVVTVGALWWARDRDALTKSQPKHLCETVEVLRSLVRERLEAHLPEGDRPLEPLEPPTEKPGGESTPARLRLGQLKVPSPANGAARPLRPRLSAGAKR